MACLKIRLFIPPIEAHLTNLLTHLLRIWQANI